MKRVIYSTMYLGHGAAGGQSMFTVPVGQQMASLVGPELRCHECGAFDRPVQEERHTNIFQAGQFGSAIGSVELLSIRARVSDNTRPDLGFSVRIAGMGVLAGNIADILDEEMMLPSIAVAHNDTFEVIISVPAGTRLERPTKTQRRERTVYKAVRGKLKPNGVEMYDAPLGYEPLFLRIEFWVDTVLAPKSPPTGAELKELALQVQDPANSGPLSELLRLIGAL